MHEHLYRLDARARPAVLAHLLALDADDRYARFGSVIQDACIRAHVGKLDFERDQLLGVEHTGKLVGLAHVGFGAGALAELALSVAPGWRCRGVARTLFHRAACSAADSGILGFACIHGHPATLRIARRLGMSFAFQVADPRVIIPMNSVCRSIDESTMCLKNHYR